MIANCAGTAPPSLAEILHRGTLKRLLTWVISIKQIHCMFTNPFIFSSSILGIFVMSVGLVLALFLIGREIMLWYWRINDFYDLFARQLGVFAKIEEDLESIKGHLLGNSMTPNSTETQPLDPPEAVK
jgi:hypothetical protein